MPTNHISLVPQVQQTPSYYGVQLGDNQYLQAPQGTSSEELKEYLKEYHPDTYEALEKIDKKYPPKEMSEEELKELANTRVGASLKPSTIKKIWQVTKNFFKKAYKGIKNFIKKILPEKVNTKEVIDYIDTGKKIYDLVEELNPNDNMNPPQYNLYA